MAPKCGGKNHTLGKPPGDSSMTYDEGDNLSFQMFYLEQKIKESMKHVDFTNLQMQLKREMAQNMERMVKLI